MGTHWEGPARPPNPSRRSPTATPTGRCWPQCWAEQARLPSPAQTSCSLRPTPRGRPLSLGLPAKTGLAETGSHRRFSLLPWRRRGELPTFSPQPFSTFCYTVLTLHVLFIASASPLIIVVNTSPHFYSPHNDHYEGLHASPSYSQSTVP